MSWKAYEQGMGYRCNDRATTEFSYDKYYYPDDAPFINYTDVSGNRARCRAHLVDTRQLGPDLKQRRDHAGLLLDRGRRLLRRRVGRQRRPRTAGRSRTAG